MRREDIEKIICKLIFGESEQTNLVRKKVVAYFCNKMYATHHGTLARYTEITDILNCIRSTVESGDSLPYDYFLRWLLLDSREYHKTSNPLAWITVKSGKTTSPMFTRGINLGYDRDTNTKFKMGWDYLSYCFNSPNGVRKYFVDRGIHPAYYEDLPRYIQEVDLNEEQIALVFTLRCIQTNTVFIPYIADYIADSMPYWGDMHIKKDLTKLIRAVMFGLMMTSPNAEDAALRVVNRVKTQEAFDELYLHDYEYIKELSAIFTTGYADDKFVFKPTETLSAEAM